MKYSRFIQCRLQLGQNRPVCEPIYLQKETILMAALSTNDELRKINVIQMRDQSFQDENFQWII